MGLLLDLYVLFPSKRKIQFVVLLILTIFTGFSEVLTIGALIPFLSAITAPELLYENSNFVPFIKFFNINSPNEIILPLALIFCLAIVIAGLMRIMQTWLNLKLAFGTSADFSIDVFNRTLHQPYANHVNLNSSSIITAIYTKTAGVSTGVIIPVLTMLTSVIIFISITFALMLVNPLVTIVSLIGFGTIYLIIIYLTRLRLIKNGVIQSVKSDLVVKSIQEGLGGIRDVILDGNQSFYTDVCKKEIVPLNNAQANSLFIGSCPRYIVEALGMIAIAGVAVLLIEQTDGLTKVIPVLATLAFGAQRMLPAIQQMFVAWASLQSSEAIMKDVIDLLKQPLPNKKDYETNVLKFENNIELQNVSFKYGVEQPDVLKGISLKIPKGSKVGFIGITGSGKSTLLDIIMGFLSPTTGMIKVDGVSINQKTIGSWQKNITHVPQSIFLADASIEDNIALGIPRNEINDKLIMEVASQAQLAELINSWPKKYQTFVGERGVRLSGGQRQRISIARALYKGSSVIVLDEATSALDKKTEEAVMSAIEGLDSDITVLIIAHRLTTLKNCDMVVQLEAGKIAKIGGYENFVN